MGAGRGKAGRAQAIGTSSWKGTTASYDAAKWNTFTQDHNISRQKVLDYYLGSGQEPKDRDDLVTYAQVIHGLILDAHTVGAIALPRGVQADEIQVTIDNTPPKTGGYSPDLPIITVSVVQNGQTVRSTQCCTWLYHYLSSKKTMAGLDGLFDTLRQALIKLAD